jgi:c(7)-type cytochrome triheme protein
MFWSRLETVSLRNVGVLCASAVRLRIFINRNATGAQRVERDPVGSWVRSLLAIVLASMIPSIPPWSKAVSALDDAPVQQQQMQFPDSLDYSKYLHSSQNHARLPCLLCHRRESNSARPNLPGAGGHLPCAGCHAQHFANSDGPICTICHTDIKSGSLKPFPRMKSFRMKFDHAQHTRTGANCATCHRPSRGGVALSIPSGFNAHNTCYRCHTPRAQSNGRDISSCGTCHQLGGYLRTPETAQAFRVNFSHAKHRQMTCNACHQVRGGMPQRRQVTAPEPLNHHATGRGQSCQTCHDGKRAFGGDDFSACKRCHTGAAWRF